MHQVGMHRQSPSVLTNTYLLLQAYNTNTSGYYTDYYITHVRRHLLESSAVGRTYMICMRVMCAETDACAGAAAQCLVCCGASRLCDPAADHCTCDLQLCGVSLPHLWHLSPVRCGCWQFCPSRQFMGMSVRLAGKPSHHACAQVCTAATAWHSQGSSTGGSR